MILIPQIENILYILIYYTIFIAIIYILGKVTAPVATPAKGKAAANSKKAAAKPAVAAASSPPTAGNADALSAQVQAQGDKVRVLKESKADKATIGDAVKILLELKAEYKSATGKDWKSPLWKWRFDHPSTSLHYSKDQAHLAIFQTPAHGGQDLSFFMILVILKLLDFFLNCLGLFIVLFLFLSEIGWIFF